MFCPSSQLTNAVGNLQACSFEKLKREFKAKRNPTMGERLLFEKAQNEELMRLNRLKSRQGTQQDVTVNTNSQFDYQSITLPGIGDESYELFCSDNDQDTPKQPVVTDLSTDPKQSSTSSQPARGKRKTLGTAIASTDKRKNAACGFDAFRTSRDKKVGLSMLRDLRLTVKLTVKYSPRITVSRKGARRAERKAVKTRKVTNGNPTVASRNKSGRSST